MGKAAWSFRPSLLISILRVTRKRTVALRVDGGGGSAVPLEGKGPWVGAWQLHFARCRGLKAANKTVNKTVQGFFEDKHRMTKCLRPDFQLASPGIGKPDSRFPGRTSQKVLTGFSTQKQRFWEVHTHARGALERGHVPKVCFVFFGFLCGVLRGHRRGLEHFVAAVLPKDPICALKLGDRTSQTANPRGSSAGLRRARIFSAAAPPVHLGG